ncbi:MAG: Hint domain-containing protein [Sulfitobacter sp.]
MARDERNPFEKHLIGLWQFDTSGSNAPVPLVDGSSDVSRTRTDCVSDSLGVPGIEGAFDLTEGSVVLNFALNLYPDTTMDRRPSDPQNEEDGAFEIRVTEDYRIEVLHSAVGGQFVLHSAPWIIEDGDDVEVTFSWSDGISCTLKVKNLSSGIVDVADTRYSSVKSGDGQTSAAEFRPNAQADTGNVSSASFDGVIASVAVYNCDILRAAYQSDPKKKTRPKAPKLTVVTGGALTKGATTPTGSLSVVYDVNNPDAGVVQYFDKDGAPAGTKNFSQTTNVIPCFTPGTFIATPRGERKVETLQVGDRVITRDNGIQTIRWVGRRTMTRADLQRAAHLKPVLIAKGALDGDLPERDMLVSPNHRLIVASGQAVLEIEKSESLVAAKHLTGLKGVDIIDVSETTYIHLMFDQHEVILSDGLWAESFQPGDMSLGGTDNSQRSEILELFPELRTKDGLKAYQSARQTPSKFQRKLQKK